VGSIAAGAYRSYAVADTGEVWAWGMDSFAVPCLSDNGKRIDPLPKPVEPLRGIKVDAVAAASWHAQALADDGSVYVWGSCFAA
jgi:regulator of chromosome condensation